MGPSHGLGAPAISVEELVAKRQTSYSIPKCVFWSNGPECIAEICLVANCPELPGIFPTYSNLKRNCCQPSGLWNFFRLENEHSHNVVKYRAFKSVPLPFDYNVG
ncbi:hypothetical protein H0E87_013515 [Populus deltoides]|uniref:Uncharacterized protein n=1 Tax=Populus deltoides TaxID=3696 RepID=A0A8T2YNP4_POPDE|nr:hypothetical protein H0E87_013515 [Populus deltoides]